MCHCTRACERRLIFGDLARCEALVGESVSLFIASPSQILLVRMEGLGDVEACLADRCLDTT
jgi:hypothetical protein